MLKRYQIYLDTQLRLSMDFFKKIDVLQLANILQKILLLSVTYVVWSALEL